jgi:cell division protein FtsZ
MTKLLLRTTPTNTNASQDDSFDYFSSEDQNSISQIETSAQDDDDDNNDIPFFKHRGES